MIYASYRTDRCCWVVLSNTPRLRPNYKAAETTFHLKNAIRKAKRRGCRKYTIQVADPKNNLLKVVAGSVVEFMGGLGITDVRTRYRRRTIAV